MKADGDLFKVRGLGSLECHGNPLDVRKPKRHILELRELGEIKESRAILVYAKRYR